MNDIKYLIMTTKPLLIGYAIINLCLAILIIVAKCGIDAL